MTQTTSLLWKQWHETRVYLWVGLGLFLGLPVIGAIEYSIHWHRRFEIRAYGFPFGLGGVLAVFLAVGITSTDFRSRLEDFWRSRPVSVRRWIGIKYLVGLAALEAACIFPILVEVFFSQMSDGDRTIVLTFFPFFWAAIYSLAFLAGCLVQRPSHAATIGLAAMLLVYLLPIVLPPLGWMNVADFSQFRYVTDHDRTAFQQWLDLWTARQIGFALGMTGLSVGAAVVSVVAVTRGWRIEAGRKMLYGSVSAALMLLFASAAFQLGTNLPIVQQIDLPDGETCQSIFFDGQHGFVSTWIAGANGRTVSSVRLRTMDLTSAGLKLGQPVTTWLNSWYDEFDPVTWRIFRMNFSGGKPQTDSDPGTDRLELQTFALGGPTQTVPLWEQSRKSSNPRLFLCEGKLYVVGERLVVLDVAGGAPPKVVSDTPSKFSTYRYKLDYGDLLVLQLVPLPGLTPEQQLAAAVRFQWWRGTGFDGQTLCVWFDDSVLLYKLAGIEKGFATFKKTGECKSTYLQKYFDRSGNANDRLATQNGLAFTQATGGAGVLNSGFSVYDIAGPGPVRQVGHFAAPGAWVVCPLPDGRSVVGGNKIWLVGPPPGFERR